MTARYWLLFTSLVVIIAFTGCLSSNSSQFAQLQLVADPKPATTTSTKEGTVAATEPPMQLDESQVGGGRSVTPIPAPDDQEGIICRVEYQGGLTSQMTIDVETHAPLKEVFPQWVVVYGYQGDEDKAARVPTGFVISKNNAGAPGELVMKYEKEGIEGQDVRYNAAGKKKVVPRIYFNVDLALTMAEPPFDLVPAENGAVRSGIPLAPPTGREEYLTFRVKYPGHGFESRAVVETETGAPVREVFPFWWEVDYLYADIKDREDHVPTSIVVYHNTAYDTKGAQLARYDKMFVDPEGLSVFYKDNSGREKEIAKVYFAIMPDKPDEETTQLP
ncbi:MAG: hypothetical protein NT039_01900 [Candidatus Berkelbacteria bacterium]|nr:hypothetical protein [Candidatus Berkelbacteria bacterium]